MVFKLSERLKKEALSRPSKNSVFMPWRTCAWTARFIFPISNCMCTRPKVFVVEVTCWTLMHGSLSNCSLSSLNTASLIQVIVAPVSRVAFTKCPFTSAPKRISAALGRPLRFPGRQLEQTPFHDEGTHCASETDLANQQMHTVGTHCAGCASILQSIVA